MVEDHGFTSGMSSNRPVIGRSGIHNSERTAAANRALNYGLFLTALVTSITLPAIKA
jgi:hypothetical protein